MNKLDYKTGEKIDLALTVLSVAGSIAIRSFSEENPEPPVKLTPSGNTLKYVGFGLLALGMGLTFVALFTMKEHEDVT